MKERWTQKVANTSDDGELRGYGGPSKKRESGKRAIGHPSTVRRGPGLRLWERYREHIGDSVGIGIIGDRLATRALPGTWNIRLESSQVEVITEGDASAIQMMVVDKIFVLFEPEVEEREDELEKSAPAQPSSWDILVDDDPDNYEFSLFLLYKPGLGPGPWSRARACPARP
ncbi:hypothetical protein FB45DRAFT_875793 [Roridomyces roridus]|uniref:Uncharacterized protein n=1 Tax=Roridomyces roridus TaxID=1738132 RepID=A0AAD7B5C1_9AGAR|nr:hypothetical protein FB45DRAFT_875793 [Roridomyces roridus]